METLAKQKLTQTLEQTQRVSGSEALLLSLVAEQVTTVFGYPGGAIMPVYDKLMDFRDSLNHILTRHEQGAIHAAQGYARVTGEPGVCFATSGPGATNLITGIADKHSLAMYVAKEIIKQGGKVVCTGLGVSSHHQNLSEKAKAFLTKNFQDFKQAVSEELGDASVEILDVTLDAKDALSPTD